MRLFKRALLHLSHSFPFSSLTLSLSILPSRPTICFSSRGAMMDGSENSNKVDIYPLRCYYFSSKAARPEKDNSVLDRIERTRSNYAANGLRTCVQGVLLVELFQQPHVLLLQMKNSFFKLPGGRLRPGESDAEGLKRKLSRKLSHSHHDNHEDDDWQIGECLGMWWSDFDTLPYPFLPPSSGKPKECTKLFLIHDSCKVYGPIISGIPQLLSKFTYNIVQD